MAIVLLDELTCDRIAAGEVVERPASVVKELVENALDAGATRIVVELRDGGRTLVRVSDNGGGMDGTDAELAFRRHATSKIKDWSDLNGIGTLGFRGEALPSIASVARVTLTTKQPGELVGTMVGVVGGGKPTVRPEGCDVGTTVTVRDLFFNTPARHKQLKSSAAEQRAIRRLMTGIALLHPEVAFQLRADQNLLLRTSGDGDLRRAALGVWGQGMYGDLLAIQGQDGDLRLDGLVGRPSAARGNRDYQVIGVNGRLVESIRLRVALEQAYGGLLAKNCYPAAVLLLALPAGFVDVNVHPTKQEVRFADENRLFSLVRNAVEEGLRVHNLTPGAVIDHIPWKTTLRETAASAEQTPVVQNLFVSSDRSVRQGPPVQVFGQLQGKYILAQGESGLLLVDQHAAHERVYFERLIHHADLLHRQELLLPLTYEASAEERAFAAEQEEELQCLGFVIEPFGGNTLLVRAVPSVLADGFGVMDLRFLLDHLLAADQDAPSGPMPRRLVHLALAACKAAIKARTGVTKQEAGALLVQLWECRNPYTCPHGRPTMIELSIAELDRRFGRR